MRAHSKAWLPIGVFFASLLAAEAGAKVIFSFTKIVDTDTLTPGAQVTFGYPPYPAFVAPSIEGGTVVFEGISGTGGYFGQHDREGIYKYSNGTLSRIADRTTGIPGGEPDSDFEDFSSYSLSDGVIAFDARDRTGFPNNSGIYSGDGTGGLTIVVNGTDPIPGGNGSFSLNAIANPAVDGASVFFAGAGGSPAQDGIYRNVGGTITSIVDLNTEIPGLPGETFSRFISGSGSGFFLTADNDEIAWLSTNAGAGDSIFTTAGGSLRLVAERNVTLIPGSAVAFTSVGSPVIDNGNVLFYGTGVVQFGLYLDDGNGLAALVDQTTPGRDFSSMGTAAIDGANVAFKGLNVSGTSGKAGLYSYLGGVLTKLIDEEDSLDGKAILRLEIGNEGISGSRIAFQSFFEDYSDAIFVATALDVADDTGTLTAGQNSSVDLLNGSGDAGGLTISVDDQLSDVQIDVEQVLAPSDSSFLEEDFGFTDLDFAQSDGDTPIWKIVPIAHIATTASVAFGYDPLWFGNTPLQDLLVYHFTNGEWLTPIQTNDITNHIITIETDSFSAFAIGIAPIPVALDDGPIAVIEGVAKVVPVGENDTGFIDPVTVTLTTPPTKGTIGAISPPGPAAGMTITYTANIGTVGADSFDYQMTDSTPSSDTATVTMNISPDTDADGVSDATDNCTAVANPIQCDSDGDGYGNRCDGDMNNNSATNSQDYVLFRQQLGQPSSAPTYNQADINCNGAVNSQDYVLFRSLLGKPSGPSALVP